MTLRSLSPYWESRGKNFLNKLFNLKYWMNIQNKYFFKWMDKKQSDEYLNNYIRRVKEHIDWDWLCGDTNLKYKNRRTGRFYKVKRRNMICSVSKKWQALFTFAHIFSQWLEEPGIIISSHTESTETQGSYMTKRICGIAEISP